MIACVLLPRFALTVAAAAEGRGALLSSPLALAPEPGREPVVGDVSSGAEAFGVRAGMRLGEALARCPGLRLIPPDPAGVADAHDRLLVRLEAMGAAVESGRPGSAWFDAYALRHVHGGLEGVLAATRRAAQSPVRLGVAPARFAALAAASRARARRAELVASVQWAAAARERGAAKASGARPVRMAVRAYLAPLPVTLLADLADAAALPGLAMLPEPLERLGVHSLGDLAALPRGAVADRFGPSGVRAHELARGIDEPLRARSPLESLEEALELPESASGPQLERGLGLLIDRLLARRERRGRALRSVVLSAVLVEGGTWRERMTFREPLADPKRMRMVLANKLQSLPAPAEILRLRAEGFGPPEGAQGALVAEPGAARASRLREAVRQARAAAGPEAALRVLEVDPDSRVPERRLVLAPWEA